MTMKIRCLAIDDEPLALQQLSNYIKKVPFLQLVNSCECAADAQEILNETVVDAIFVDINMPDLNGLDFVRSLQVPPLVVFTTAYSEYAIEGYKVDAVDYLLKPFGFADIQRAANKLKRQYELMNNETETASEDDSIFVKTDYKVVRIKIADIRYIEGMSEYLRLYVSGQNRSIITLLSIKKMEEHLSGYGFMRVHRSYIINLKHIQEVGKSRVILDDGSEIPVGDIYKGALTDYISSKYLGK